MTQKTLMTRRTFLLSLLAAGGVAGIDYCIGRFSQRGSQLALYSKLDAIVSDEQAARAIGREYLKLHPEEKELQFLIEKILPEQDFLDEFATASGLKEKIVRRIREDYTQDRTVMLNKWILSRTEGRICALRVPSV